MTPDIQHELQRRTARPQRHRLLQGYPMAPLMNYAAPGTDPLANCALDPTRPLIIGVLPHTFCNPKVRGCGFCTFPHEKFAREPMRQVIDHVAREIDEVTHRHPALRAHHVEAVYFGGGTANLTPPDELERLCALLASRFTLADCELTLEGVPAYFLIRGEAQLDVLARATARHRRISMGVQTFDPTWLRRMGRDKFGDRDELARLVASAHRRGFTASADLLFNLPGAPRELALADVRTAIELGFDQICAYNLVLTDELDTEWAHDRSLLRAMPDPASARATWLAVRATLLDHGFVQTTLTNFERADVAHTPRRFVYERASFDPATHDGLGFGPGAISTFSSRDRATKWQNATTAQAYMQQMRTGLPIARSFDYAPLDLKLLQLTRNLAALAIDRAAYQTWFGSDPAADFAAHLSVLESAGLVRQTPTAIELTPDGMFYADAVAGLLADARVRELRRTPDDREVRHAHMG